MVVAVIIILVVVECVGKIDFNAGIIISVDDCHLTVMSVEIGVRDGQHRNGEVERE